MYSESDLQSAVEAGAITADNAEAFRAHIAGLRSTPMVDEEHFRLLTGFNDIFVAIAGIILIVAVGWIGGGLGVAAVAWGLAEYFTRVRRMALPSIVFLIAFAIGVSWFSAIVFGGRYSFWNLGNASLLGAKVAVVTAIATYLHWWRFKVPITVAAGASATAWLAISLLIGLVPALAAHFFALTLVGGIGLFLFAMRWDMLDRARTTRRSDVAFWLHLTAAPMIAHSLFKLIGVFDGRLGPAMAIVVLALYVVFGVVALAVDRRALLVSSLAYVLYALYTLLKSSDATDELTAPMTAMVIGSALLLLSAFWHKARAIVVIRLPHALQERLPYLDREVAPAKG